MSYSEVKDAFLELKEILIDKKNAIIKKDIDKLSLCDESTIALAEKISRFDISGQEFSEEEKENLKKLGEEIKTLQENNEILIKHSLNVINNILSGILNIAQNENCSYNAKGIQCHSDESLDISSITEEA